MALYFWKSCGSLWPKGWQVRFNLRVAAVPLVIVCYFIILLYSSNFLSQVLGSYHIRQVELPNSFPKFNVNLASFCLPEVIFQRIKKTNRPWPWKKQKNSCLTVVQRKAWCYCLFNVNYGYDIAYALLQRRNHVAYVLLWHRMSWRTLLGPRGIRQHNAQLCITEPHCALSHSTKRVCALTWVPTLRRATSYSTKSPLHCLSTW